MNVGASTILNGTVPVLKTENSAHMRMLLKYKYYRARFSPGMETTADSSNQAINSDW